MTVTEYNETLTRLETIFDVTDETAPEYKEAERLTKEIQAYEEENYKIAPKRKRIKVHEGKRYLLVSK